eukprot:CAMPEP_0113464894 /NCGR_PEP_ID=MMETSP0014_2-20120614/13446_1 /TAXON_ID=2857 /ORGANISM="Nitzschia sp." /LENGTH=434 /DNA_ID=CAMNT_0000357009 /DNA_START=346 /DNA_END=1650 /DNA_ORIENTATION=+ /assembly_acc=CAM_ASM_000159
MISGAAYTTAAAVAPKLVTATSTVASTASTTTTTTTTTRSASTMMIRTMKGSAAGGVGGSRRPPSTASMIMGGRKNRFFDANTTKNCHYRRRWQSTYEYSSSSSSSGGSSSSSSFFNGRNFSWSSFFSWYSKKLDTHPVTTKCISAGIISAVGNIFAQGIAYYQEQSELDEKDASEYRRRWEQQQQHLQESSPRKPFEVDLAQVSRFAFLNVVFVAPVLHHWYQFINRAVPGKSLGRVAQRVFWDEFVFSPMYIPVFLGMLWKLEGSSNEDIVKMTKSEVPSIIIAEWALWVPGMFGIFRFVPVKFQVLAINSLGVVWQTFLAYMASHAHAKSTNAAEAASADAVPVATTSTVDEAGVINTNTLLVSTAVNDHEVNNKAETATTTTTTTTHVLPHIPGVVVEEEKVVPLVLNTIIRKHTPKYQEFDYDMSQGED